MKKIQYLKFIFCLGFLGIYALVLSITPVQSWADITCGSTNYYIQEEDTTPDADKDGFSNWFECASQKGLITYYNGGLIPPLDPNKPDLFVIVTKDDNSIEPVDLLKLTDQLEITIHRIDDPSLVADYEISGSLNYRQVTKESPQRAVRLHLSDAMDGFEQCPQTETDVIVLGKANVGTPMDMSAFATVYTNKIALKIQCLYEEAGGGTVDPAKQDEMNDNIDKYIRHTAAHELLHNAHLRYLDLTNTSDARTWKTLGDHYSERDEVVMSRWVVGSTKKEVVNLPIGIKFTIPDDIVDAKAHLTVDDEPSY